MPSVLVVDDSPIDRRLAMGILEKQPDLVVSGVESGAKALNRLAHQLPDLVVTDLQMPDMNGLDLVRAVRGQYPLVPVVLMTAHGSEEIAVQALEEGAASYVPKAKLADNLADTVFHVLAAVRADRRHDHLLDCLERSTLTFVLDNHAGLIYPLVDYLQQQIARLDLCDETDRLRMGIALQEALLNAFYHGNLALTTTQWRQGPDAALIQRRLKSDPYQERKIHVYAELSSDSTRFIIRDEGAGFTPPAPNAEGAMTASAPNAGRGLVLMRAFMDEVVFNPSGNEVTMVKRCHRPVPAAASQLESQGAR